MMIRFRPEIEQKAEQGLSWVDSAEQGRVLRSFSEAGSRTEKLTAKNAKIAKEADLFSHKGAKPQRR